MPSIDDYKIICDSINKASENYLFELNDEQNRAEIKNKLTSILSKTIEDVKVKIATWESLYPCMPVRLLAIEAYELQGDSISDDLSNIIPDYAHRKEVTTALLKEALKDVELSNLDIRYETTQCYFINGYYEGDPSHIDDVRIAYKLDTPYNTYLVNIKPPIPIKYIKFECVIKPNMDFKSVLDDQ